MALRWAEESFELPVEFDGRELVFQAVFYRSGYSYRIVVDVDGRAVQFEPDEERNFRAVMGDGEAGQVSLPKLQAVAKALEQAFR